MAFNTHQQSDAGEVACAPADRADTIGPSLLGEPTSKSPREMRWGRRGSFSLRLSGTNSGCWYDHEAGEGGDLLDLLGRERGVRLGEHHPTGPLGCREGPTSADDPSHTA